MATQLTTITPVVPPLLPKKPQQQTLTSVSKPAPAAKPAPKQACLPAANVIFKAKSHSYFSNKDVAVIGPEILKLTGGTVDLNGVKPGEVVEAASAVTSPLHKYFEWDDSTAAVHYRLQQARLMINAIEFEVIDTKGSKTRLPAFESVKIKTDSGVERRYFSMPQITSSPKMTDQYIEQAEEELKAWKRRYKKCLIVQEFRAKFAKVFKAIDQVVQ